jgi:hypothetical protein
MRHPLSPANSTTRLVERLRFVLLIRDGLLAHPTDTAPVLVRWVKSSSKACPRYHVLRRGSRSKQRHKRAPATNLCLADPRGLQREKSGLTARGD